MPCVSGERILEFHIDERTAGLSIRQFLTQELSLSPRQISRLKFTGGGGIGVNGRQAYVVRILQEGDVLTVRLTDRKEERDTDGAKPPKIWNAPSPAIRRFPFEVLYEDPDLMIVNKPSGLVCHPSPGHYADTLANQAAAHIGAVGTSLDIRVVGRLDKETSGLVVFARSAESAALLQRQRQDGRMVKEYLALAEGTPEPAEGRIDLPLRRAFPGSFKMTAAPDGKEAVTFYRTVGRAGDGDALSLLRLRISHGRTHQIRVHLSSSGYPVAGDPLYGSGRYDSQNLPGLGEDAICLHAARLVLRQPFTGKEIRIAAPVPEWVPADLRTDRIQQ